MKKLQILFIITIFVFYDYTKAQWHNWSGNQKCTPIQTYYPITKNELLSIVHRLSKPGNKICAVGAGHSFSNIACTDGYHINMKNLNKIISINEKLMHVKVESGISIKELHEKLAQYGLAISNSPAMGSMTLGGVICTATHGTGKSGSLSNFITQIELIDANGDLHELSKTNNIKAFKAACVSLGALGIIYSITIQCEPLFYLQYSKSEMSTKDFLEQYPKLLEENDYFQFRWQLDKDLVFIDLWNKDDQQKNNISVKKVCYDSLQYDKNPEIGIVSEIAISIHLLPKAIEKIKSITKKWNLKEIAIPEVVGRFVQIDTTSYLSPCADRDVVYLNIATDCENKYYDFFHEFCDSMYLLNGRPHWGKINFLDYDKIHKLYGQNFIDFLEIKKLFDPNNIFSNSFIDKLNLE